MKLSNSSIAVLFSLSALAAFTFYSIESNRRKAIQNNTGGLLDPLEAQVPEEKNLTPKSIYKSDAEMAQTENNSVDLKVPPQKNCTSLQTYLNASKWSTTTKFTGFEYDNEPSLVPRKYDEVPLVIHQIECGGGYILESSPMGERVCKGYISYYYSTGKYEWYAKDEDCRWKE